MGNAVEAEENAVKTGGNAAEASEIQLKPGEMLAELIEVIFALRLISLHLV